MITVQELQERVRERIILGLDAANFTKDVALADKLDAIKALKMKKLFALLYDLNKRGIKNLPSMCILSDFELVEGEIKKAYREAGLNI